MKNSPEWITYLRTHPDAWQSWLDWLAQQRQLVLEQNPKSWDEENNRQGQKKALDNVLHLSTIDQKNDAALNVYMGGKKNG